MSPSPLPRRRAGRARPLSLLRRAGLAAALAGLAGCFSSNDTEALSEGGAGGDLATPPPPSAAIDAEALAVLGAQLFGDARLGPGEARLACASCHLAEHGFGGPAPAPEGAPAPREPHVPGVLNLHLFPRVGAGARALPLEERVALALEDPSELGARVAADVLPVLAEDATYQELLVDAFGDAAPSAERVAAALAAHVASLVRYDTPYDAYLAGDATALSGDALRGLELFEGKAGCHACHPAPDLTDLAVHGPDGLPTPGLRHLAESAPYLRDGSLATLEEVVARYDRGEGPGGEALGLTAEERAALVAFLRDGLGGAPR